MADTDAPRPDPDRLLQRLHQADEQARLGRLRIYFGASAGVGKTYAMLEAARATRAQGVDVLAGLVETHGRKETAALLDGLDVLPRVALDYRGHALPEFDLDGALARRPALLLLDELAHSNAPGARHAKRWQDVQELLRAGIDVWTTLNVQHLDSLNEAVGSITGVRVWETVPDAVFDEADEIILVDLSADELLRRLKDGKVYVPDQARHATRHFFRKGNLIALRELALRRTAEHVDDDVQAYRREAAIEPVWRTREAVAACISDDAEAEHVLRAAARLAQQLDCDLHAIHVEPLRMSAPSPAARERLARAMALADTLAVRVEVLRGADAVDAATRYLRRHNITKAVLGRGHGRRLARLGGSAAAWLGRLLAPGWLWHRHSFADRLAAACPEVDVLRVGAPPTPAAPPPGRDPLALGRPRAADDTPGARAVAPYLWACLYCGVAAAISNLAYPALHQTNIVMFFLLAVVGVALRHGRGPAALASVVSVGLFDFFFVQPYSSFAVSDVQYLLTFVVLLGVGLLIGQLTAGLRAQAETSTRREADARGLYEFARELSSALLLDQIMQAAAPFLHAAFGARSALYVLRLDDRLHLAAPIDPAMSAPESAVAQWVFDHGRPAGAGTATLSNSPLLYLPLKGPMHVRGVLVLQAPDGPALYARHEARRQAEAYATLIAIALERQHYVEVAQQALVNVESEKLRGSLLAAVSHDLRTPLTGLMGMAEALSRGTGDARGQALAIRDQARRMHAMVVNLLDMARLQNHAPIKPEWQSIEELVGAALAASREALAAHRIVVQPLSSLPLVECDALLIERVLCNLLENAAKYTPAAGTITLSAQAREGEMQVSVSDDGPGVPPGSERRIFQKFSRGERESATPGVGLGLAVCQAIVEAHRGRIWVEPVAPHGARFTFTLPLGAAPALPPEPPPADGYDHV
ncbi:sensor histidine kinase [Bordetella genomosp. 1]|uniref:histidine kinase n=1 Tax=Bordetella genomosp. 1 TaxID=1395607 RepID=A0ABX4EZZ8_9BORD|nr:sensor histidine kinase KdpD [Bordetella genomosp. 1]OZI65318.1 two-component sensor histidine kinase [Bordetella genomosp. 1]